MLNQKITTVIVSKNLVEIKNMTASLKDIDLISVVGQATSLSQAISVVTHFAPQLVFVCVELESECGLEVVRVLRARNILTEIVFVAGNGNLAYESLQLEPLDFLIKPVNKELILEMLLRLKTKLKNKELIRRMNVFAKSHAVEEKRVFKHRTGIVVLFLEEIVFCKAELAATSLTLKSGEIVKLKSGIKETLETINSENFIRIGRSYCINRDFLRKIDKRNLKCRLHFNGNEWELPISKNTIGLLEKLNVFPV